MNDSLIVFKPKSHQSRTKHESSRITPEHPGPRDASIRGEPGWKCFDGPSTDDGRSKNISSTTDEHGANTDEPGPTRQRHRPSRTQHGVNTNDPGPARTTGPDRPGPARTIPDELRTVPDRPEPNTDHPGPNTDHPGSEAFPGWTVAFSCPTSHAGSPRINTVPLRTFPEPTRSLHGPSYRTTRPGLKIVPDLHKWSRQF